MSTLRVLIPSLSPLGARAAMESRHVGQAMELPLEQAAAIHTCLAIESMEKASVQTAAMDQRHVTVPFKQRLVTTVAIVTTAAVAFPAPECLCPITPVMTGLANLVAATALVSMFQC